ncbi:16S rRNA (guanine(966)-N(2))-methyltransferase RsmD [Tissierella creatinini]|nr:16S rRNA (guanine(966)-N(2))-methyltransferase RsmD [Tissierella creatinini]TJX69189.1 16S rRNA (guanine(966)-N(2))-methyltransferase RsmD [Soehngenia saccharolytica]
MRVISGERKGHKLKAPKGMETRPTEDRIKENLFNILRPLKGDALILDLFSGSGAIGIEFLSRGSKLAYFIDISQSSIDTIKDNLNNTCLIEKSIIIKRDAIGALKYFKSNGIKFDYIYMDPPFKDYNLLLNSIKLVADNQLLTKEGKLIIEHESIFNPDMEIKPLQRYDSRKYGSKTLSFYKEVS